MLSDIKYHIKSFFANIANFFRYGWEFRNQRDYDYAHLDKMILYKMKRLLPEVGKYTETHCVGSRSLKLCIKLLTRLSKRDSLFYAVHTQAKFDKAWGKFHCEIEKTDSDEFFAMKCYYDNETAENRDRLTEERNELFKLSQLIKERDTKLFFSIMAKYREHWWN